MIDTLFIRAAGWRVLLLGAGLVSGCGQRRGAEAESTGSADRAPAIGRTGATSDSAVSQVVLTEAAATTAGIRTERPRRADGGMEGMLVEAPGQVEADPSRTAFVSSRAAGRLERLTAVVGDRVAAHQTVAWVMSPAFLTAQNDFRQATRRAELLAHTPDSAGAHALAAAARSRLGMFGLPDGELDRLEQGGAPSQLLQVTAPFEGSLVEGLTLAGASVEPGTPIFRLIDLRELDVAADVPERFLPDLHIGQRAVVLLAAYPDLRLEGRVERIKDELDPTTRTIEALVHVGNRGRALRPGMFAKVQLQVRAGPASRANPGDAALVIAAAAVVSDVDQRYVFVETAPFTYERRVVELAANDARFGGVGTKEVVIHGGVRPGERIVVEGAFTLKSELAKAGFAEEE
jgi:multidrug efflux pump subunit AcrA (membrane-fusion protein)